MGGVGRSDKSRVGVVFFRVWIYSECFLLGDDSMRMFYLKVGFVVDIFINVSETDFSLLIVIVVSFSGREEFCLFKRLRNGYVGKRFFVKEGGLGVYIFFWLIVLFCV